MKNNFHLFWLTALMMFFGQSLYAHDFEVDGIYYNYLSQEDKTVSVTYKGDDYYYNEYSGNVVIPESVTYSGTTYSVTSIGSYAFDGCYGLTSIEIPNSVTSIGDYAFEHCWSLTNIVIPNSVTSIGSCAFEYCWSLTSIVVDANNSEYDSRNNCNAIIETSTSTLIAGCKNTIIPNSVTSIGYRAFEGCRGLTSIEIPNSVAIINWYAFEDCTGLTSIEIPNSVTSIGENAFAGTAWYDNHPDGLVYAGRVAYTYKRTMPNNTNLILKDGTLGIAGSAFFGCTGLTSIEIPNSVTYIGSYAFSGCTGLTSIEIPNSVTNIGRSAFYNCKGLTSIEIPNSVTSIGDDAFAYCTGLTSIEIPNSVTSIGYSAFEGCTGLTSITVLSPTPFRIKSNTFSNTANATLYVPKGSKAAYEKASYWNKFKEIVEIEVGTEEKYNVTIPEFAFGKVTSDKAQAAAGEVVTLTAQPNTGYYLRELNVQRCTGGEHAQAPSVRSTKISSAETVTMTYNAATDTYTGTYTMPACDVTVAQADFVAKTAQTIVAQDVTCTLGDTDLAISATNQTQGGGTLTYAVSAGSDVVRVNAESGALNILKAGTATVTVTAAEMEKYSETSVQVKVTVLNTIVAQAENVSVPYDGATHGIVVNVSAPTAGYTVTYGTEAGQYTLTTSPTQTVVGTKTVYYKVSATGYVDLEGSATITIRKADIAASNYDTPQSTVVTGEGLVYIGAAQTLVSGGTTNEGTTYYRVNGGAWSTATPSATEPGTYVIEWYVAGDANHNDMGSKNAPAGSLTVNILATKEVTIVNGLATFYNGTSAYNIPGNAKAWTGTIDYANGCVNMVEVTGGIIPAGTAVVLTSDDEKVTLVQSLSEASAIVSDLKGTDTYTGGALTGAENIYVLHSGEFVWATSGTLASGKAYLVYDLDQAPTHAAAMRLWLNFDGASSIDSLEASAEKSTYYDLQGTQVVAPRPNALYIRNGKKVMVK